MQVYAILMTVAALVFLGVGLLVYKGKPHLLFKVGKKVDRAVFGKAVGRPLLVMAGVCVSAVLWGCRRRERSFYLYDGGRICCRISGLFCVDGDYQKAPSGQVSKNMEKSAERVFRSALAFLIDLMPAAG